MLPVPQLDDRWFERIVQDARQSIPKLLPEWTDENVHDPGITMIELFAWLIEMQQYYLNRVPERSERKFLKLLGVTPRDAKAARADVTFRGVTGLAVLPRGTKLLASGVPFETVEKLTLLPAVIECVIVRTPDEAIDWTASNSHEGVSYYAFGSKPAQGNRLYIGFDRPLPAGVVQTLSVQLFEQYPVPVRQPVSRAYPFHPSARTSWAYYGDAEGEDSGRADWIPVTVVQDTTNELMHSGRIRFELKSAMRQTTVHPAGDRGRYWLCCLLEEAGYELAPKIAKVTINTVTARQCETLCETFLMNCAGEPNMRFTVSSHLAYFGKVEVQIQEEDGIWTDWLDAGLLEHGNRRERADRIFHVERSAAAKSATVVFGDGATGRIPREGKSVVRIVAYAPDFASGCLIGASSGLPHQSFKLERVPLLAEDFALQVGFAGKDGMKWRDWRAVEDLAASMPGSQHYLLDAQKGELTFGDNEHGMIPNRSEVSNIRIISCKVGGGAGGNVKNGLIAQIAEPDATIHGVTVTNPRFASGGKDAESLNEAKLRLRRQLGQPTRAVTASDYEHITLTTPGLRVARAKAIPLFVPGLRDYPAHKMEAQMTVVAVPFSEQKKPVPSAGFLKTIHQYLDSHRLLTTELHVVGPEYIKVTVQAVVVVEPYARDDARRIADSLSRYLQPLDSDAGTGSNGSSKGWEFGRAVYKGDLFGVMNAIPGVSYVQDMWLVAEGSGVRKEANGDITIPPHGLVYSGDHEIELVVR